jgi:hypothetical protein
MARKHHCKHNRTPGGYARRLAARGLARTPQMTFYPDLHAQGRAGRKNTEGNKS